MKTPHSPLAHTKAIAQLLWQTSRPRFWMYTLGPFILGSFAGATNATAFTHPIFWIGLLAWTLPLNLFLYGVNDLADHDTDQHNPKKKGYEHLLGRQQQPILKAAIIVALVIVLPFLHSLAPLWAQAFLWLHMFLCWAYSMLPIRFKARPFVDAASNLLYALPGFYAYFTLGGTHFSPLLFLAACCWCAAMHAFSAIPDIAADKKAHLKTTAVVLGEQKTLSFCALLYLLAAILSFPYLSILGLVFGVIYQGLIWQARSKKQTVFSVYKVFPLVNAFVGFILTMAILFFRYKSLVA